MPNVPLLRLAREFAANHTDFSDVVRANTQTRQQDDGAWQAAIKPATDTHSTAAERQSRYATAPHLQEARILYAVPHLNHYRIQLSSNGTEMLGARVTDSSPQPFSVISSDSLTVGTSVLVYYEEGSPIAYIIGCLPGLHVDAGLSLAGCVVQGSNAGLEYERYYRDCHGLFDDGAQLLDWSNGGAIDALSLGEWSRMDSFGGGIFVDSFMKFMRVDEMCGLWLFDMDKLARLAGSNLDILSDLHEQRIRNDNGEGLHYQGSTAYPWEALGVFQYGTQPHKEHTEQELNAPKGLGFREPRDPNQRPFYRLEEFRGYLGQAYMRQLQIPHPNAGLINTAQSIGGVGVFREQVQQCGGWSIQSAHSLLLTKRLLIPIAKRRHDVDDPGGDDLANSANNYKFAGLHGDGPEHKLQTIPAVPDDADLPNTLTAALLQDIAAHVCNWQGVHPFHYHVGDYDLPEQGADEPFRTLQYKPDFRALQTKAQLPAPTAINVPVDHRHSADYYETETCMAFLPDGNFVLRDGHGFELRTENGNVRISTPGDIIYQPGRSSITYAGDDIVLRGRNSIDITSSTKDVRLKAENNLELLAANSGKGRMLLESRAENVDYEPQNKAGEDIQDPGITLLAKHSRVNTVAENVYLRSTSGDVVLDAAKGFGDVHVVAKDLAARLTNSQTTTFTAGQDTAVYYFDGSTARLPGKLQAMGSMAALDGGITCHGALSIVDGVVQSNTMTNGIMDFISPGSPQHTKLLTEKQLAWRASAEATQYAQATAASLQRELWAAKRIGNASVLAATAFAPRTPEQMQTTGFHLPIVYWQQLAAGQGLPTWTEPGITYQGQTLAPHPGLQQWQEGATFLEATTSLRDAASGRDVPRGDVNNPYEAAELADWVRYVPAERYTVITE